MNSLAIHVVIQLFVAITDVTTLFQVNYNHRQCRNYNTQLVNLFTVMCNNVADDTDITLKDACIGCFQRASNVNNQPSVTSIIACASLYLLDTNYSTCFNLPSIPSLPETTIPPTFPPTSPPTSLPTSPPTPPPTSLPTSPPTSSSISPPTFPTSLPTFAPISPLTSPPTSPQTSPSTSPQTFSPTSPTTSPTSPTISPPITPATLPTTSPPPSPPTSSPTSPLTPPPTSPPTSLPTRLPTSPPTPPPTPPVTSSPTFPPNTPPTAPPTSSTTLPPGIDPRIKRSISINCDGEYCAYVRCIRNVNTNILIANCFAEAIEFNDATYPDQQVVLYKNITSCILAKSRCSRINPITGQPQNGRYATQAIGKFGTIRTPYYYTLQVSSNDELKVVGLPSTLTIQKDFCSLPTNLMESTWNGFFC